MKRIVALLISLVLASACSPRPVGIRIAGSTSVQPLAEMLAEAYARTGGSRVSIQGGGSTAGVQAVLNGIATLGALSRNLTAAESAQGLVEHIIGYDVLTIVVHPENPLAGRNLSLEQVRAIFSGKVTDWADLGGPPGRIHLVSREAGSGSREAFRTLVGPISPGAIVQNSSGAIRVAVMDDPQGIGYVSLGVARMGGVAAVRVENRRPGDAGYPLVRPLSFVTRGQPEGEAAAFLRFVRSAEARRLIREEGLVPVRE